MPSFNQNVNINRHDVSSAHPDNWGFTRHLSSTNIFETSAFNGQITFPHIGEGVDIIISEGMFNHTLSEFNDSNGNSRFVEYQWDQHFTASFPIDYSDSEKFTNHATHVAGTAAGLTYGWAKGAKIYSLQLGNNEYGVPYIYWFDAVKKFHEAKIAAGNNRPTIVNASWTQLNYYLPITKVNFRGELIDDPENITAYPYAVRDDSGASAAKKNRITRFGICGGTNGKLKDTGNQFLLDGVKSLTDIGVFYISAAGNTMQKIDEPGGLDYNNYFMSSSALDTYPRSLNYLRYNKRNPLFYHRRSSNSSDGSITVGSLSNRFYHDATSFSSTSYTDLTALNRNDELISEYSDRGPGVDILAAGSDVVSVLANGSLGRYAGTSMASPQIVGMTALLLEKWGNFRPKQLKKYWREYGISSLEIGDLSLTPFTSFLSAGDPNHFGYFKRKYKIPKPETSLGYEAINSPFWADKFDFNLFACGMGKIAYLNLDVDITTLDDYEENSNTDPTITVDTEINLSNKNLNTNKQNLSGYRYLKIVASDSIDSNFDFKIDKFYDQKSTRNYFSTVSSGSAFPYGSGHIQHMDFKFGDSTAELSTFSDHFTFNLNGSDEISPPPIPTYFSSISALTASWTVHTIQNPSNVLNNKIGYISSRSLESETIRLTGSQLNPTYWTLDVYRDLSVANAFDRSGRSFVWRTQDGSDDGRGGGAGGLNFAILDIGTLSSYEYFYGNISHSYLVNYGYAPPEFVYIYGKNALSSVLDDDWELLGKINYPVYNDSRYNENTEFIDNANNTVLTKYFADPNDGETTTFNGHYLPTFMADQYDQNTIIDLSDPPPGYTPTYNIIGDATIEENGNNNTYTVNTTNVADGTVLHFSIDGTTDDFVAIDGDVIINSNTGSFNIAAIADSLTETSEEYTISLRTGSVSGPVVATKSITIINTSSTPSSPSTPDPPTYLATTAGGVNNIDEGSTLTINVQTTHVSDGTTLFYKVAGIDQAEFVQPLGNFQINLNNGQFTLTPVLDSLTEGPETFQVHILTDSLTGPIVASTGDIVINDTSQSPQTPVFNPDYTLNVDFGETGKYIVLGNDRNGTVIGYTNPPLNFNVGDKVRFSNSVSVNHPLYIKTVQGTGTGDQASGVSGAGEETVDWIIPSSGTYYYQCSIHDAMHGEITVTEASSISLAESTGAGVFSSTGSLPSRNINIFANFDTTAVKDPERVYYNLPKNELPVLNQITASTRLSISNHGPGEMQLVFTTNGIDGIGYNDQTFNLDTFYFQNQTIYFTVRVKTNKNYPAKYVKNLTLGNAIDNDTISLTLKDSNNKTLNTTFSSDFGSLSAQEFGGFFKGAFKYDNVGKNLKLHAKVKSNGKEINGFSNTFNISPVSGTKDFRKINEDNNQKDNLISYLYQPNLKENQAFFTNFLGQIVGDDSNPNTLGVKVYEKISNFLLNSNDIDYANIDNLISNLKLIDSNVNKFSEQYPASLKRIVDFFSINRSKLRPTLNKFNQNFNDKGRPSTGAGKNLGPEIKISDTLSGGDNFKPIVALEKFSGSYTLLTTDPTSSFDFRNLGVNKTFQLSSYNTRWGWGLVLPEKVGNFTYMTNESGGNLIFENNNFRLITESNESSLLIPEYYTFYEFISTTDDSNIFSFYDYNNKNSNLDTLTLSGINNCIDEIILKDVYSGTNLI